VVPTFPPGGAGCLRQGTTVWVYNVPAGAGCIIGYTYPGYTNAVDRPNPSNLTYTAFTYPVGTQTVFEFYGVQGDVRLLQCSSYMSTLVCPIIARRGAASDPAAQVAHRDPALHNVDHAEFSAAASPVSSMWHWRALSLLGMLIGGACAALV
jgi:hypothetical protein